MDYSLTELPTGPLTQDCEAPSVSTIKAQPGGILFCGLNFSNPLLLKIQISDNFKIESIADTGLEALLKEKPWAVINGLWSTTTGDAAFAVLHGGFAPNIISKVAGKFLGNKKGPALLQFLRSQDGGLGAWVRHSLLQIDDHEIILRRELEPGMLWDAAKIGDFVFGLAGGSVWREPYLHAEKRETLRKDLESNFNFHRDAEGTFWFLANSSRLLRMGQTDIKAKPTPLKFPNLSGFFLSSASSVDGWLYGTCNDSRTLVRVRRNVVSLEEEMQSIVTLDKRITGLLAIDSEENSRLLICTEAETGAEFYTLALIKADDPEPLPPIPVLELLGVIKEIKCVSSLTLQKNEDGNWRVWGGEGRLGCELKLSTKPRILCLNKL